MPRAEYQEQLDSLREDVLYMGELVVDRLRTALGALERKDDPAATSVIEGDAEVNQLYLDLERECVDLLALQQPVAGDLRLVAASFKIITDLERVGDLATNLGEYALEAGRDVFPEVDVQELGNVTLEMLTAAMAAYEAEAVDDCYAVAERDDDLDALCSAASETIVRDLLADEGDTYAVEDAEALLPEISRVLLTIRDLERVGDHAVNVAARTLYMVENDDDLIY